MNTGVKVLKQSDLTKHPRRINCAYEPLKQTKTLLIKRRSKMVTNNFVVLDKKLLGPIINDVLDINRESIVEYGLRENGYGNLKNEVHIDISDKENTLYYRIDTYGNFIEVNYSVDENKNANEKRLFTAMTGDIVKIATNTNTLYTHSIPLPMNLNIDEFTNKMFEIIERNGFYIMETDDDGVMHCTYLEDNGREISHIYVSMRQGKLNINIADTYPIKEFIDKAKKVIDEIHTFVTNIIPSYNVETHLSTAVKDVPIDDESYSTHVSFIVNSKPSLIDIGKALTKCGAHFVSTMKEKIDAEFKDNSISIRIDSYPIVEMHVKKNDKILINTIYEMLATKKK